MTKTETCLILSGRRDGNLAVSFLSEATVRLSDHLRAGAAMFVSALNVFRGEQYPSNVRDST